MPSSLQEGKKEIYKYVDENVRRDASILDVGPGECQYGLKLRAMGYKSVDALEVEPDYIEKYRQRERYRQLHVGDVRTWEPTMHYDVVIFGDVLEHLTLEEALRVLHVYRASLVIASVPWMYKQGILDGHVHEIHLQDQMTFENVDEDYKPDLWLFNGPAIGVFVKLPVVG